MIGFVLKERWGLLHQTSLTEFITGSSLQLYDIAYRSVSIFLVKVKLKNEVHTFIAVLVSWFWVTLNSSILNYLD